MLASTDTSPSASFRTVDTTRELLFGEIDSSGARSLRTNASLCNLTFSSDSRFLKFWLSERTRNLFLSHVEDKRDLAQLRLVCHDFSARVEPYLFKELSTTFRASTFTKPSRVAALQRVGHHIKTFKLNVPHTTETFLPPLIHPQTGEETNFVYVPQVHAPKTLLDKVKQPKYGSWEITDLLIRQYPSIFHAATNVPAFVKAFSSLQNLEHLIISCPRHAPPERARPSTVDYVLISIRIAIELAPLHNLKHLSLLPIHPSGLFYLQPVLAFGSSPKSLKRWSQIETITIHVENDVQVCGREQNLLRLLHTYLRNFASSLTRLYFRWDGRRGPCPLPLDQDSTAPAAPHKRHPQQRDKATAAAAMRPHFRKLQEMELKNAIMDSSQVSAFITEHSTTLTQFNFEDVKLRSGTWDDALSPLISMSSGTRQNVKQVSVPLDATPRLQKPTVEVEVMEVPIMLSCENLKRQSRVLETLAPPMFNEKPLPERSPPMLCRWLARAKACRTTSRKKSNNSEGCISSTCHVRNMFKNSGLGWR